MARPLFRTVGSAVHYRRTSNAIAPVESLLSTLNSFDLARRSRSHMKWYSVVHSLLAGTGIITVRVCTFLFVFCMVF